MTPAQFWQIEQQNQQNRQEFMQGQQEQLMGAIGQFAGQFADNKALEAKGSAYGDFMKRHGDQLGFDPEWIKGFLSESPRQQAMIGDSIIGMQNTGRQLMNMNYLNAQMGPRTAGPATGTGAGAAAPRESFTF
jgi:uncharacterized protein YjbJ (UPF0337 family)